MKVLSPPQLSQNTSVMECKDCIHSPDCSCTKNRKSSEARQTHMTCTLRRHKEAETQHWHTRSRHSSNGLWEPQPLSQCISNLSKRCLATFFDHWGSQGRKKNPNSKRQIHAGECPNFKINRANGCQTSLNIHLDHQPVGQMASGPPRTLQQIHAKLLTVGLERKFQTDLELRLPQLVQGRWGAIPRGMTDDHRKRT